MLKCEYKKTKKKELNTTILHCDFEEALSAAIKECFPFSQIKYCFFHYGQILFRKINSVGENGLNIKSMKTKIRIIYIYIYNINFSYFKL